MWSTERLSIVLEATFARYPRGYNVADLADLSFRVDSRPLARATSDLRREGANAASHVAPGETKTTEGASVLDDRR